MTTNHSRVLCLGEAMVVLRPAAAGGLARSDLLRRSVGGAEANVAGALVALGIPTCWMSRLGNDPFGDYIARDLAERGVAVLAEHDDQHPTGVYLKDSNSAGSRMFYYRSGSAAAAMDCEFLAKPAVVAALSACQIVHTSGITAGILDTNSTLLPRLVDARDEHGFVLSVDLNWRPALWRRRDTEPLHRLLRAADVVLLGADEAEVALGASTPRDIRRIIGPRARIVLKSDALVATEIEIDGTTTAVPALRVEVVEPVGAGDGFAAGYLTGLLMGSDAVQRLRLGHLTAACVLAEPGDHAHRLPSPTVRRALLTASDEAWAHTTVSSRAIESPALHEASGTPS